MQSFQRFSEGVAALRKDVKDVWKAFFDINEEDKGQNAAEKIGNKIELRLWYFILDYGLAALFAALVVGMTAWGFKPLVIFFAGWVFAFVVAMYFVVHERIFDKDISLGSDYRRAMDTLKGRRKLAWSIAIVGILVKASIWDGPEQIVMFFRKEIDTWLRVSGVIALLAVIQTVFWQVLWSLGYNVFVENGSSPAYIVGALILIYINQVRKYFGRSR